MKRFIEFDILRGILLLMMSVDHSPSSLRRFTDQPLGFFSTAECFVFVSAFLAGMLFRKRAEKFGFAAARSSSIHRAGRIYRAHLVTLFFAFVLGSFFLSELPGIRNLLDSYLMNPWAAIGGSLALLFRPPLMDILPMYVLFSFLTPAAFGAAQRWGWKTVLFMSFSVWVIAQADVRDMLVNASKDLSFVQLGPFDLFAWQFLWVGGLFVGQRFLENKSLLPMPHLLRPLLALSAIAFLLWRWISITSGPDPVTQTWLFDKWHLGPLRLINFAVAASVTATFLKYLNRWEAPLRPFLLIGRHMLPVFCSQICLSVLLIGRTESALTIEPIISALVICQLLTAPLFAWFLELRSVAKQTTRPISPAPDAKQHISLAETRMKGHPLPSRTVKQPILQPLKNALLVMQGELNPSGNLNRSSPPRGNRTKLVRRFKAGNHLRFAAALLAISIHANAFTADAQLAPDIATMSGSASGTPTLNLRVQVMPGGTPPLASNTPSVDRFEQEVTSLENRRIEFSQPPIIFYGSSSIRRWKTLSQDFVGYPVVNCGFGGSRLSDCVRYVSRLGLRLKPAAVVLYAGDNDLAQGALPDQAFASFRDLYRALRSYSEQMPIAYISVKPSPARIRYIDNILRFNQMVQAFLQNQPATKYIDIYTAMLGPDQKPNPALFAQDQIHLSGLGYQILRRDVSIFLSSELHPFPLL